MKYQPENAIYIPKFTGDSEDKTLYELTIFLECKLFFIFLLTDHIARPRKS